MMGNPVLDEAGPLSVSQPLYLVHHGGGVTVTRGKIARLPVTAADVGTAFGRHGLNAWTSTPARQDDGVAFVVIEPDTPKQATHRVIHSERIFSPVADTTRYQLQDKPIA